MTDQTKRTFVAIELPESVQAILASTQDELRARMDRAANVVRWARPEGTHLTLFFLGDTLLSLVEQVETALQSACAPTAPFALHTGSMGVFPNPQRARVLWVGLQGDSEAMSALYKLQGDVSTALEPLGFKPDTNFNPHLTLGRVRDGTLTAERTVITDALRQTEVASINFSVREVSLMESRLEQGGALYTQISSVKLR